MPQLLALEWNDSEARFVVAASRGDSVVIEQAFSTPLRSPKSDEDDSVSSVGEQIAAAMNAHGVGRLDTLVAVGRSGIELRQLSLPPAPEEELPEMVRFQAMREFNELNDDWLLDFVPTEEPTDIGHNVLAAAIGPAMVREIERSCQAAGLKPQRLVLRPYAAASLLRRVSGGVAGAAPGEPWLLVDLLADEVDLTVMIDHRVVFLRTARMGGDPLQDDGQRQALLGEIRRTIAAAHNQLGEQRIESIVLCGTDEEHVALADTIKAELGTSTETFDPFKGLELGRGLQSALPDDSGRFAPLLGMALAELEGTGHAVDFLHPRRRREPPRKNARIVLAALAVTLLVASYFVIIFQQKGRLDADVNALESQSNELTTKIAAARKTKNTIDRIQVWSARDICWLDELRRLSEHFPPAKEARLTGMQFHAISADRRMELEGLVDESATIGQIAQQWRTECAEHFEPEGAGSGEAPPGKDYAWWFKSSLSFNSDREKP